MRSLLRRPERLLDEAGAAVIYVAIILVILLTVAAFAIDVGYHRVVRNQLQNAADATALAACNMLYDRSPTPYPPPPPAWANATTEANDAVGINTADKKALTDVSVATGWWNIALPSRPDQWATLPGSPPDTPPGETYGPGVRATIVKVSGQNSGPIGSFFGVIAGVSSTNAGATATAVAASPGSLRSAALVPVAISKEVADQWATYNSEANPITIGSPYFYPNSLAGQWTSFLLDDNSTTAVRGLVDSGNPTELNLGDDIWILPGVHDTLYDNMNQPSIQNNYRDTTVWLPVVNVVLSEETHAEVPLYGVIPFHIICAGKGCGGGNEKIIRGYFVDEAFTGKGPFGNHYGPLDRCRLYR